MGVGIGVTLLSFMSKFFMLWATCCQASYHVWGQVLLTECYIFIHPYISVRLIWDIVVFKIRNGKVFLIAIPVFKPACF